MHAVGVYLLITLASARLSRIITTDTITEPLRFKVFKKFPPIAYEHEGHHYNRHFIGTLISCPWCSGVHVTGAVVLATTFFTSVPLPVLGWFACAYVVGMIGAHLDRN